MGLGRRIRVSRPSLFDRIGEDFRKHPLSWNKYTNAIWVTIIGLFFDRFVEDGNLQVNRRVKLKAASGVRLTNANDLTGPDCVTSPLSVCGAFGGWVFAADA